VAVTGLVTVFMIHARRNTEAAQKLLGSAAGTLITDRAGAYSWWPLWLRQLCWAHLKRDFTAISERVQPLRLVNSCSQRRPDFSSGGTAFATKR
jgi:hypothetical protein